MSEAKLKKRNNNAITGSQLLRKKHNVMQFDGLWLDTIGSPEWTGSISLQGDSSQGKTHAAFQLVEYLANNFGPVLYNSLEEQASLSFKNRYSFYNLNNCRHNVLALKAESLQELTERLKRKHAPKIVVIDSVTFFHKDPSGDKLIDSRDFVKMLKDFPEVLFVCLVHEDKGRLDGRTAQTVVRLSQVKLRVEGYRVFVKGSRAGGGAPYDVWPEKAAEYWDMAKAN